MRRLLLRDEGTSAIWVAAVLLFLIGATALAVDVSGFYEQARAEQTAADLTCLAGVAELPESKSLALQHAAEFAEVNWPALSGVAPKITGSEAVLDNGAGTVITITAGYGGDDGKMAVTVSEGTPTHFSRVLGPDEVTVSQVAYCKAYSLKLGVLPFGVLPGGFGGGLQAPNPCGKSSGNCGRLFVARLDGVTGQGNTAIANIAYGSDRDLRPSWTPGDPRVHCTLSASVICHVVETDTGVDAGALGEGFVLRFSQLGGSNESMRFTVGGHTLNGDTFHEVLGGAAVWPSGLQTLAAHGKPAGWNEALHGEWATADLSNHYYYNGDIAKCASPRLGGTPIVAGPYPTKFDDLDFNPKTWKPGDPYPEWPEGSKDVKIVGHYFIYIEDPNDASDFVGGGQLKRASAKVIWMGPNVNCVGPGGAIKPWEPGEPKVIRLVNESA